MFYDCLLLQLFLFGLELQVSYDLGAIVLNMHYSQVLIYLYVHVSGTVDREFFGSKIFRRLNFCLALFSPL